MWAIAIATFLFAQSRRKAVYALCAPVVLYAGLSLFVNYMAARNEIRELVWYEQALLEDRFARISGVFRDFQWLDMSNARHRDAIDLRLNQNLLVGIAVQRLESGEVDYASGATAGTLILGLIPRALWPDKPAVGGSGTIVHDFTGIDFAEGTSIGVGQVFEFFVNFGVAGVIGGFLLFGLLIGQMDLLIARYLEAGDPSRSTLWFLVGLTFLNPGGSLLEVVVGAAAAYTVGRGIGFVIKRHRRGSSKSVAAVGAHNRLTRS